MDYQSPGGRHEVPSPAPNVESGFKWGEKWAFYGIDSHLKGMGFPMRPHAEVIRETQTSLKDLFRLFAKGIRLNVPMLFQRLSSDWFGAPLLPALALLGCPSPAMAGTAGLEPVVRHVGCGRPRCNKLFCSLE